MTEKFNDLSNEENNLSQTTLDLEYNWSEDVHINLNVNSSLLDKIMKINKLPFNNVDLYFSDDLWVLRDMVPNNISGSANLCFQRISFKLKDSVKLYAFMKLVENKNGINTIKQKIIKITQFLRYLELKDIINLLDMSSNNIIEFIKTKKDISLKSQRVYKSVLKEFFMFYSQNIEQIPLEEYSEALDLGNFRALKAEQEASKLPDIPQDYYNKLFRTINNSIEDKAVLTEDKSVACMLIILSQTGLRISELMALEINKISIISLSSGEEGYYLNCFTWKGVKGDSEKRKIKIPINKVTLNAYNTLTDFHNENRIRRNSHFLFVPDTKAILPIKPANFTDKYLKFLYNNRHTIDCMNNELIYPELRYVGRKSLRNRYILKKDDLITKTIVYPIYHQFRVHACTALYNQGVTLEYIKQYMNHLSEAMAGYYVRPKKDNIQENMSYSISLLTEVVTGETRLLGPRAKQITDKINEFIKINKCNITKDIKTITNKLAGEMPIRAKNGGVCIKGSLRECSMDSITNELYCAYDICPNIMHMYYMADISLEKFRKAISTYNYNKDNGFIRESERELRKVKSILNTRLIPELEELKRVIVDNGGEYVKNKYPNLRNIINRLDIIEEEVILWKEK